MAQILLRFFPFEKLQTGKIKVSKNIKTSRKGYSFFFLFLIFSFLLMIDKPAFADHFQGGYFTYKDLGGGKYEFLIKGYWKKTSVATLYPRYVGKAVVEFPVTVSKTLLPDGETVEHVQKQIVTWAAPGFYEIYYDPCCLGTGSNYQGNLVGIYATVNYNPAVRQSAPQFFDSPLYNFTAGVAINHKFDIKDPEGDEQEFSLEIPNGLSSDAYKTMRETGFELKSDGTMSWENPLPGKWLVHIRVHQKINGVFTGTYIDKLFIMNIKSPNGNLAPVFSSLENKVVRAGEVLSFDIGAADSEGQNLTLKAYGTPFENGATFTQTTAGNVVTAKFFWNTTEAMVGTHFIHLLVGDDHTTKMYSRHDLSIEVVACNTISTTYELKKPCAGANNGTLTINATGGHSSYQYSIDNGISFNTSSTFENLSPGSYSVLIKDGVGCLSLPETIHLEEVPLPVVTLNLPSTICASEPGIRLTGTPEGGYFGGTGVQNGFFYPHLAGTGTHAVEYIYINENGCSNTASEEITVREVPVADAGEDDEVYINKNGKTNKKSCTTLAASAIKGATPYSYLWSTGETTQTINVCPTENTTYVLTVTDAFGCSDTSQVTVNVYQNNDKPKKDKPGKGNPNARLISYGVEDGMESEGIVVFPNPISDKSQLLVSLTETELIKIEIMDLSGKVVKTLFAGKMATNAPVSFEINNDFNRNSSYFCRIVTTKEVYYLRFLVP